LSHLVISLSVSETSGYAPHIATLSCTVEQGNPPYTFLYDFGDGTPTSNLQNEYHTYTNPGTYTATITVTDSEGQEKTESQIVTVSKPAHVNQPPTASIDVTGNITQGSAPLTLEFIGRGSDPEGQILNYVWDFGDGNTGNSTIASHTFNNSGDYIVRLTVTDPEELAGTSQVTITATESSIPQPDPIPSSDIGKAVVITGGGAHQQCKYHF